MVPEEDWPRLEINPCFSTFINIKSVLLVPYFCTLFKQRTTWGTDRKHEMIYMITGLIGLAIIGMIWDRFTPGGHDGPLRNSPRTPTPHLDKWMLDKCGMTSEDYDKQKKKERYEQIHPTVRFNIEAFKNKISLSRKQKTLLFGAPIVLGVIAAMMISS